MFSTLQPVLVWVTIAALSTAVAVTAWRNRAEDRIPGSDWLWGVAILIALVAGRWPSLLIAGQLNPDESIQLAGAITLRHDPNFWRSVFGMTTGPLDFYALLPAGTVLGRDDYFSARLTGLVLLSGALLLGHQTIALNFGRLVARVASFGAVCFEALTLHLDFLHCSTELLPIILLSAATYLFFKPGPTPLSWRMARNFGIGALLGAVPLAKLQAGPIAAAGGLLLLGFELAAGAQPFTIRLKSSLMLVGGAFFVPLVFALMLAAVPDRSGAITSYLLANLAYTKAGFGSIPEMAGRIMTSASAGGAQFLPWILGLAWLLVVGLAAIYFAMAQRRKRPSSSAHEAHDHAPGEARAPSSAGRQSVGHSNFRQLPPTRALVIFGIVLFTVSIGCVVAPRRPFPHYLQLLVVPGMLTAGALFGVAGIELEKHRRSLSRAFVLAGFAGPFAFIVGSQGGTTISQQIQPLRYHHNLTNSVANVVRHYSSRGEPLAVWGWSAAIYVGTGMRQATRHAITEAEILSNPFSEFFRSRYLTDFLHTKPPVFIDASFIPRVFPNREIAHDVSFPELGAVVRGEYTLVETLDSVRIYVRNERVVQTPSSVEPAHLGAGPATPKNPAAHPTR